MRARVSIIILLGLFQFGGFSQNPTIDSIKAVYPKQKGAARVKSLSELCYQYIFYNLDSSAAYGAKALEGAKALDDKPLMAQVYNDYSIPFLYNGEYERSLKLNEEALALRKELNDSSGILASYAKIGNCYHQLGRFEQSLEYNLKAAEMGEALKDSVPLAQVYDNIGSALIFTRRPQEALEYHQKSLDILLGKGLNAQSAGVYANMGSAYRDMGYDTTALEYMKKSLQAYRQIGQEFQQITIYMNLGSLEQGLNRLKQSKEYYLKALEIGRRYNALESIPKLLSNVGYAYFLENELDSSYKYLNWGKELSQKVKNLSALELVYGYLTKYYIATGEAENAYRYMASQDSVAALMLNEDITKAVSDMQIRYETAEKERELAENKAVLAEEQIKVKKRTNWIILLGALVLIVVIIMFSVYRQQKLKQDKLRKEAALKEALEKERIRTRLQEERIRISRDLHDHIGSQLTIISSRADELAFKETDIVRKDNYEQISDRTRETMAQLRETIWAMNNEAVTIAMFTSKLREYTGKFSLQGQSIQIINEIDSEVKLSPAEAINLFRICQEAINNAIKYAGFTSLIVKLTFNDGVLRLQIVDDGNGFDNAEEKLQNGYGLANMKQRTLDIKGQFKIDSSVVAGTSVVVELPVNTSNYV